MRGKCIGKCKAVDTELKISATRKAFEDLNVGCVTNGEYEFDTLNVILPANMCEDIYQQMGSLWKLAIEETDQDRMHYDLYEGGTVSHR